jgi:hypothetical protein
MRERATGPAMSVIAYPDPEHADAGLLHARHGRAGAGRVGAVGARREVTIVLDRSGSMQGEKFAQATGAAKQIINALGDEAFRIVDYAAEVSSFSVDADTPDSARGRDRVPRRSAGGGGDEHQRGAAHGPARARRGARCRSCSS